MRKVSTLCTLAVLTAPLAPAEAQYYAPYSSPGYFTAPETVGGALGAGVANDVARQKACRQVFEGRSGFKTECDPLGNPAPK